jgi:hypothetical protein
MIVPHLDLIAKPRRVERGDRTKLRFKVRAAGTGVLEGSGGAFGAVAGATVQVGKKEAETGPRGFATIRARFKRRGPKKVFADASGYAGGEAKIRVRKPD